MGAVMESWFLLMLLTHGGESVPIRVPMTGYEQCMAEGHYAETIASQLKDVRVDRSCKPTGG